MNDLIKLRERALQDFRSLPDSERNWRTNDAQERHLVAMRDEALAEHELAVAQKIADAARKESSLALNQLVRDKALDRENAKADAEAKAYWKL